MDYAKVLKLPQYFRNLSRLSEIVGVLVKHGFGDLVQRLNLAAYLQTSARIVQIPFLSAPQSPLDFSQRLRTVCEELGPTFVKFGQLIASRPDLFPDSITREFRKLQDKVAPFPATQAREVIESELKLPLSQIYLEFDDTPIAAASIAQVHKARTHDGALWVVKVQRPNLERIVDTDIEILSGLAALFEEHFPESKRIGPTKIVDEFSRSLRAECDFRREAQNLMQFAQNFKGEQMLIVPGVNSALTSRRVLTESFIDGFRADDVDSLRLHDIDSARIAELINEIVLRSIFEHRFFHADPHPGNLFVTKEGKVAFIDFGAMGRLDPERVSQVLEFLVAIFSRDLDGVVAALEDNQLFSAPVDKIMVKREISELIDQYLGRALGSLDAAELVSAIFEVVRRHGISPPADLLLVGKSLTTLEYLGALLDPGFDPITKIQPYLVAQYTRQLTDPKRYASALRQFANHYRKFLVDLPQELRIILRTVARDEFTLQVRSKDFTELCRHQNKLLNRAMMGLLGALLLSLGVFFNVAQQTTVSYVLMGWGALILVLTWIAIRRSGGTF
jgi:ubiquinone biosynthesis protein